MDPGTAAIVFLTTLGGVTFALMWERGDIDDLYERIRGLLRRQ